MENELNLIIAQKVKDNSIPNVVCAPLLAYLTSYKENGGTISETMMQQIIDYCSQIETDFQKIREHEKEMYKSYLDIKETIKNFKK